MDKRNEYKKNTLDEYHNRMKEYSLKVNPFIINFLYDMLNKENRSKRSAELVKALYEKRLQKPRLREFLLIESFKIISRNKNNRLEDELKPIYQIGAAIEVYNLSTYLINWVLDKKGIIQTEDDKKRAIIEGMRLYDLSKRIIRTTSIEDKTKNTIIRDLEEVNNLIYLGQGDDIDELNIKSKIMESTYEEYIKKYEKTCQRKCGDFLGFVAKTGGRLAGGLEEKLNVLHQFGTILGTGIQIVNDVADNIPLERASSIERPYQDQFSDIENGLITASIYTLLKTNPEYENYIGKALNYSEKEEFFKILLEKHAFDLPMKISRKLRQSAKKVLKKEFKRKEEREWLSATTSILDSSKIYRTLRDQYRYKNENNISLLLSV